MRTYSKDVPKKDGEEVILKGWVNSRRDHGKLIFIDLRDKEGLTQVVFTPEHKETLEKANTLRPEWVIEIKGKSAKRPEKLINTDLPSGTHEVQATELHVLTEAKTPPFDVTSDGKEIGEENRLRYRYLDLRRPRMQENLKKRAKIEKFIRDFLTELDFIEIATPYISKSTPEGARDYLVPSRLHQGNFYALPQSPQQYKQLLMVAGLEKYFQIARCFRDEDTRGDRQPEFTQLDLEMSFVEREDVIALNEKILIELVTKLYPKKKIQQIPFPRISYKEAMEKYGTDRPDLRKDKNDPDILAFGWIIDFPFFEKDKSGNWTFTHNPFSAPQSEHMENLLNQKNIPEILTTQYDVVLNGYEVGGGSIRNHKPKALSAVFEVMGFSESRMRENFGHILEAFEYGAPPHGGIAWGLDRLVAILQNEPTIREVFSFPKTGDGRDLMMNSPSSVSKEQLEELGIEIKKKKS